MGKKVKTNWWVDLILFTGFITTFFLDFTGLSLHQLIGIFSIAIAGYHLFIHKDWVRSVAKRFFDNVSGKSRLYYVVDYSLMLGFILIGFTGLFISTWFNLPLANYTSWRDVHVAVSIATLALLVLKLTLHLRWIVSVSKKIFAKRSTQPIQARAAHPVTSSNAKPVGRREFLATMGVIGAASLLAMTKASQSLAESMATTVASTPEEPTQTATETQAASTQIAETRVPATEVAVSTTEAALAEPTTLQPTETVESTLAPTAEVTSTTNCTVRCNKGCAYPGRCRRYTDGNSNGLCDLGECL